MSTSVDILRARNILGRKLWSVPEPFGPDGWQLWRVDGDGTVIVSVADHDDGVDWLHASIAHPDRLPLYEELVILRTAVFGDGWAYQVFAPPTSHISIHDYALHLWGRLDGLPALPDFGRYGTI